eukprot:scaffold396_cov339-Prasinococcus_capsulatus_cf.AAC.3
MEGHAHVDSARAGRLQGARLHRGGIAGGTCACACGARVRGAGAAPEASPTPLSLPAAGRSPIVRPSWPLAPARAGLRTEPDGGGGWREGARIHLGLHL